MNLRVNIHKNYALVIKIIYFSVYLFTILLAFNIQLTHLGAYSINAPHQWLTASTVKFVENWESDGYFHDYGMMLELPNSIESPSIITRHPYVSYLPGAPIEIALLKKLLPTVNTLSLTQIFNLINQLLIASTLAGIFFIGSPISLGLTRYLLTLIVFLTYQLHPSTLYVHANVFFADQAILLPFVLSLLLELIIRKQTNHYRFILYATQSFILAWATLCDWLSLPLMLSLFIFRVLVPPKINMNYWRTTLQLFLLPACILTFFILQVYLTKLMPTLLQRFLLRTGQLDDFDLFFKDFIDKFFINSLGISNTILLLITYAYIFLHFLIKKRNAYFELITVCAIMMLACVFHAFILTNHAVIHADFAIVKFYMIIALATFGVIPAMLMTTAQTKLTGLKFNAIACVLCVLFSISWQHMFIVPKKYWHHLFAARQRIDFAEVADWLAKNAQYQDMYFSKQIAFEENPPQAIAISRKLIHKLFPDTSLINYLDTPTNTQFHAILSKHEANQCRSVKTSLVTKIYSNGDYWLVYKINRNQLEAIKKCLF